MSRLVYYVAATMDGYIATENHELGWLEALPLSDDATPYEKFYQSIGAAIIGAGTYEWIMKNISGHWPYQNIPSFILSSRNLSIPAEINAVVTHDSAHQIVTKAKAAAKGKDIRVLPVSRSIQAVPNQQRCLSSGAIETIMDIKSTA
ncbi:dihydrofolate reductase family protein [Xenorhabdus siamensis]|uniref:dihydrofolate reductase family protein n=1 Tax=Xenorhabdus siamensis TaxID=3136254 RepID=UPI0030F40B60